MKKQERKTFIDVNKAGFIFNIDLSAVGSNSIVSEIYDLVYCALDCIRSSYRISLSLTAPLKLMKVKVDASLIKASLLDSLRMTLTNREFIIDMEPGTVTISAIHGWMANLRSNPICTGDEINIPLQQFDPLVPGHPVSDNLSRDPVGGRPDPAKLALIDPAIRECSRQLLSDETRVREIKQRLLKHALTANNTFTPNFTLCVFQISMPDPATMDLPPYLNACAAANVLCKHIKGLPGRLYELFTIERIGHRVFVHLKVHNGDVVEFLKLKEEDLHAR